MPIQVVQPGDTLWKLAQQNQLPVSSLSELNGLKNGSLVTGLALYIPNTVPERFYKFKENDQVSKIGKQFGVSLPTLLKANPGMNPAKLKAGQTLLIPTQVKYNMQTLAFLNASSLSSSISTQLKTLSDRLSYVAVTAYIVQEDGSLLGPNDQALLNNLNYLNIKSLLVLTNTVNGQFSPELAGRVLDPTIRPALIQSIIKVIRGKNYAGISLDFEFIPSDRRDHYSDFIKELKNALGMRILHVNAPSKTQEMLNNPIVGAVDYKAVGERADLVTLLTYDYGYPTGPPNPVSPPWWIYQVLNFAITKIPKKKLMIGIPFYGYDWDTETLEAQSLSANMAQNQAINHYAPILYSVENQSPYYTYTSNTTKHTVWFEDIRSLSAKYQVIETNEILGASFWQLSDDFPQNWEYLKANIQVIK